MNIEHEIIDIEWEGSFKIQYDREKDEYNLDNVPTELLNECGFYQIYGRHPVYGKDVLLYIGETKESKVSNRSFRVRLNEHLKGRFFHHTNISVNLGPCSLPPETVEIVESILIYSHIPALNIQHTASMKLGSAKYLVRNWGFTGNLSNVCTGNWDCD